MDKSQKVKEIVVNVEKSDNKTIVEDVKDELDKYFPDKGKEIIERSLKPSESMENLTSKVEEEWTENISKSPKFDSSTQTITPSNYQASSSNMTFEQIEKLRNYVSKNWREKVMDLEIKKEIEYMEENLPLNDENVEKLAHSMYKIKDYVDLTESHMDKLDIGEDIKIIQTETNIQIKKWIKDISEKYGL